MNNCFSSNSQKEEHMMNERTTTYKKLYVTEIDKNTDLIANMILKGATKEELLKAVQYSADVIDAEKHHLDYKQSEIINDIAHLRAKYQKNA